MILTSNIKRIDILEVVTKMGVTLGLSKVGVAMLSQELDKFITETLETSCV